MTKDELDKIRIAYIKVYGNRWREVFVKYYWCVYDGPELGSTDVRENVELPVGETVNQQNL